MPNIIHVGGGGSGGTYPNAKKYLAQTPLKWGSGVLTDESTMTVRQGGTSVAPVSYITRSSTVGNPTNTAYISNSFMASLTDTLYAWTTWSSTTAATGYLYFHTYNPSNGQFSGSGGATITGMAVPANNNPLGFGIPYAVLSNTSIIIPSISSTYENIATLAVYGGTSSSVVLGNGVTTSVLRGYTTITRLSDTSALLTFVQSGSQCAQVVTISQGMLTTGPVNVLGTVSTSGANTRPIALSDALTDSKVFVAYGQSGFSNFGYLTVHPNGIVTGPILAKQRASTANITGGYKMGQGGYIFSSSSSNYYFVDATVNYVFDYPATWTMNSDTANRLTPIDKWNFATTATGAYNIVFFTFDTPSSSFIKKVIDVPWFNWTGFSVVTYYFGKPCNSEKGKRIVFPVWLSGTVSSSVVQGHWPVISYVDGMWSGINGWALTEVPVGLEADIMPQQQGDIK